MKLTATQSRPIDGNWTYYPDITLTIGHLHRSGKQGITGKGQRVAQKIREIQEMLKEG